MKKSENKFDSKQFFFDQFIVIQIIATSFVFVFIWILQYFNEEGNPMMIGRISFQTSDPPWMPPGEKSIPLIGLHHFGDWTLSVGWAMYSNCYQLGNMSCQQTPLGNWVLRLFGLVNQNYGLAYFAWVSIAIAIYLKLIGRAFAAQDLLHKILYFVFFILFTSGNIISLDRGSVHLMAFALLGYSYFSMRDSKKTTALIFFTLAVSLKPQLLLASLYLLKDRKTKKFFVVFLTPILTNAVLLLTFPGNILLNLRAYLTASAGYISDSASFGNIMNSVSLVGIMSRTFEFKNGWDTSALLLAYAPYLFLPGFIYIIIVIAGMLSKNLSNSTKLILALSSISLVVPSSGGYLLGWSSLVLLILFSEQEDKIKHYSKLYNFVFFSLVLVVTTPGFILLSDIPGFSRHIQLVFLVPILIFLLIFVELVLGRKNPLIKTLNL
jgi:hypothetical protein